MSEISCRNCTGACCKPSLTKPYVVQLDARELTLMEAGGNQLTTAVEPAKYDRENAAYPMAMYPNSNGILEVSEEDSETWPLPAGFGRYVMTASCGHLMIDANGQEVCGVYIQRPQMCRDFEVGALACIQMRDIHEVPLPMSVKRI